MKRRQPRKYSTSLNEKKQLDGTENDLYNTRRVVVADMPAMWSYTYLWEKVELKWVIVEGLVPDVEVQDSIACHKIGRTHTHLSV